MYDVKHEQLVNYKISNITKRTSALCTKMKSSYKSDRFHVISIYN